MLLTITTSHQPATDLGHLLHKHPDRHQFEEFWFGRVHVFYPEASPDRCTAAILLEVDPIGLVRNRRRHHDAALEQYVNDRPYVASSFLSVALARMFQTALGGRCKARPELAAEPIELTARLSVIKCRGGADLVRTLFEPLGYTVETRHHPLDERFVEWGAGAYHTVTLSGHQRLADLLRHFYVLVPVLDDDKHYFVGDDEVDKLLGKGAG
jgi:3' terminal RNA ribose 2'-O-methyltransferase Hen1